MPEWLVAAAALSSVATTVLGGTAVSVYAYAAIATGLALVSYLLRPKRPDFGTADRSLYTTIRSGIVNARWVLGRARIGGVLTYILEPSDSDNDIHMMLMVCEGNIDGIEKIWVNGEEVAWETSYPDRDIVRSSANGNVMADGVSVSPTAQATVNEKAIRGHLQIIPYYNGVPAGSQISTIKDSRWTDLHKLTGKAAVYIKLNQPNYENADGRVWTGLPNFEFLVKGQRITWPGNSTPTWTDNAAAIRYWWLTERRAVPHSAIDRPSFRAAYDYCGEIIRLDLPADYPPDYLRQTPRYAINGIIQSSDDHAATEAEMDFAWAGNVIEVGGKHFFRPGRDDNVGRPIPTIEPDMIISRQSIQPAPALTDRINAATMRLAQSRTADWQQAVMPEVVDDEGVKRDGDVRLPKDLGVRTLVCCNSAVARLMTITLRRARAQKRYEIVVSPGNDLGWLGTIPSDIVYYNDPDLGINKVRCVVVSKRQNEDFSLTLSLEQQLDGTHADTLVLPPLFNNRRAAPRSKPLAPTGVKVASTVRQTSDNTAQSLVSVSWNPSPHEAVIKITGPKLLGNVFENTVIVAGLATTIIVPFPGVYSLEIRHRDRLGTLSDAVEREVTVDWTDIPDVVDITGIKQNDDGSITITYDTGNTVTIASGSDGRGIRGIVRNATTGVVTVTYTDGTTTDFTITDGAEGGTAEWIYRATTTDLRPARPSTTSAQKLISDFVPSGWSDDPPSSGRFIWVSSRHRRISTIPYSDFSVPSPFRGPPGFTGPAGPQGERGPAGPRNWVRLFTGNQNFTTSDTTITFNQSITDPTIGYDLLYLFGTGFTFNTDTAVVFWQGAVNVPLLVARASQSTLRARYMTIHESTAPASNAFWKVRIRYLSATQIAINYESAVYRGNLTGVVHSAWGVIPTT